MRPVCRNVVPAGLQTCLCLPAAIRLNVRRLMRIYQSASLSWRFGYRRIWHEGFHVNHKRVYCLYHV